MAEAATAPLAGGRHQRRLRNYLLDSHFQLKYASYLVGIAVAISVCLGIFLWRTSQEVLAQSGRALDAVADDVGTRGAHVDDVGLHDGVFGQDDVERRSQGFIAVAIGAVGQDAGDLEHDALVPSRRSRRHGQPAVEELAARLVR